MRDVLFRQRVVLQFCHSFLQVNNDLAGAKRQLDYTLVSARDSDCQWGPARIVSRVDASALVFEHEIYYGFVVADDRSHQWCLTIVVFRIDVCFFIMKKQLYYRFVSVLTSHRQCGVAEVVLRVYIDILVVKQPAAVLSLRDHFHKLRTTRSSRGRLWS